MAGIVRILRGGMALLKAMDLEVTMIRVSLTRGVTVVRSIQVEAEDHREVGLWMEMMMVMEMTMGTMRR